MEYEWRVYLSRSVPPVPRYGIRMIVMSPTDPELDLDDHIRHRECGGCVACEVLLLM